MKSSTSSVSLLLYSLVFAAGCAVPSVDIIPRYGTMDVSGDYSSNDGTADLNAAGLVEDDGYIGGRVDLDMGLPTISFSTQTTTHDGPGELTETLQVGDQVIMFGNDVDTGLDLSVHNLCVTYSLIPIPLFDAFDIGIGFGASLIQIDASIQGGFMDNFARITADEDIPLPTLAVRAGLDIGDFEASALFTGMSLDFDSVAADFYDLDVLAQYHLIGGEDRFRGAIGLGYRSTVLDFSYEDGPDNIDLEMDLDGPYVALNFSF